MASYRAAVRWVAEHEKAPVTIADVCEMRTAQLVAELFDKPVSEVAKDVVSVAFPKKRCEATGSDGHRCILRGQHSGNHVDEWGEWAPVREAPPAKDHSAELDALKQRIVDASTFELRTEVLAEIDKWEDETGEELDEHRSLFRLTHGDAA